MNGERSVQDDIDLIAGKWEDEYGEIYRGIAEDTGLSVADALMFALTLQMRELVGQIHWLCQTVHDSRQTDEPWKRGDE